VRACRGIAIAQMYQDGNILHEVVNCFPSTFGDYWSALSASKSQSVSGSLKERVETLRAAALDLFRAPELSDSARSHLERTFMDWMSAGVIPHTNQNQ